MAKCNLCGGKMRKTTSAFGYVSWYCVECGNEDVAFKGFQKPKRKKQWLKR